MEAVVFIKSAKQLLTKMQFFYAGSIAQPPPVVLANTTTSNLKQFSRNNKSDPPLT